MKIWVSVFSIKSLYLLKELNTASTLNCYVYVGHFVEEINRCFKAYICVYFGQRLLEMRVEKCNSN